MRNLLSIVIFLLFSAWSTTIGNTVSFQGLGDLPSELPGPIYQPNKVSPDGSVVVGFSYSGTGVPSQAFIWSKNAGIQGLNNPSDGINSRANSVSSNGAVSVGTYRHGTDGLGNSKAIIWKNSGNPESLNGFPNSTFGAEAYDVSNDGSVIVGHYITSDSPQYFQAFRWTESGGAQGLGFLETLPDNYSVAQCVSSNGSIIGGYAKSSHGQGSLGFESFRWTQSEGMQRLGVLNGTDSFTTDIAGDGSAIIGYCRDAGYLDKPFRWTATEGMQSLGIIPDGPSNGWANGISGDGFIIVGSSWDGQGWSPLNQQAFIWDEEKGIRNLQTWLENDYGLNLSGWILLSAVDISDDGLTIVGYGINPDGIQEGWIATIPEPSTFLLFGVSSLILRKSGKISRAR